MNAGTRKIVPRPKGLNCPNCGSAIELRAMGAAATVVCSYCSSTLDATNPQLVILQKWQAKIKVQPLIPLGSRGNLRGVVWEVIGFQQRGITVEDTDYFWREYVLFNPYKGFRYLTEYDNHWNLVAPVSSVPVPGTSSANRPTVTLNGTTYSHFQNALATTTFVIGEFPWLVQVGEVVRTNDYVAPPKSLSSESTENEVTWSSGEYVDAKELWTAFQVPGAPRPPIGIYSNQPGPVVTPQGRPWKLFFFFSLVLLGMMIVFAFRARRETALEQTFTYQPVTTGEKSFVTPPFELHGTSANVRVEVRGELNNALLFLGMALINEETGQAFDFGRQISMYHGIEDGSSWVEDEQSDSTTLPSIPGGRYYLRVDPEVEIAAVTPGLPPASAQRSGPIRYTVKLIRDVPFYLRYFLGVLLLLIPLPFLGRKGNAFENRRWAESDYGAPPGNFVWPSPTNSEEDEDE